MSEPRPIEADVAIVGGGTAGLSLACALKRLGVDRVVVLEREREAGGIPRHCGHYPFGLREYGRLMRGPDYARRNVAAAHEAGVEILIETTVTRLRPGGQLDITTPRGSTTLSARRVVLCTGVRESSRAQRLISGDRPAGVMSTAALQSLVYLKGIKPFSRPVILGSELVSFSAINTCRHLGIRPVAMAEEDAAIIARSLFRPYLMLNGIPLVTGMRNPCIVGQSQVEALSYETADGHTRSIPCDGIIVSGRFRPEAALLKDSHLMVDAGTGGPVIDQFGRCSDPSFYATGNLLRPVETSGFCWREAKATAKRLAAELQQPIDPTQHSIRLGTSDPAIRFVLPQRLSPGWANAPQPMPAMQIGLARPVHGKLVARQAGKTIWSTHINSRPVRRLHVPLDQLYDHMGGGDIELAIEG